MCNPPFRPFKHSHTASIYSTGYKPVRKASRVKQSVHTSWLNKYSSFSVRTTRWLSLQCEPKHCCLKHKFGYTWTRKNTEFQLKFYLTLCFTVYMFEVSFTKHKKCLREMIFCGHSKNSFRWLKSRFCRHLNNFVFLIPDFWTECPLVDQLLSMVTLYMCYVFAKRLCNNTQLSTTSPVSHNETVVSAV